MVLKPRTPLYPESLSDIIQEGYAIMTQREIDAEARRIQAEKATTRLLTPKADAPDAPPVPSKEQQLYAFASIAGIFSFVFLYGTGLVSM